MRRALLCTVLAGLLATTLIVAAPASIPIYQQTAITQPGHYIVTRDIQVASGYAIEIQSDDVILDLNDHRVISTSTTDEVIYIGASNRVSIRNGQVWGGYRGISSLSTTGAALEFQGVVVSSTLSDGLYLEGVLQLEIVSCAFKDIGNSAINARSPAGGAISGHIVDNSIIGADNRGIDLASAGSLAIRGNAITESVGTCLNVRGTGVPWGEGGGNLIAGNTCLRETSAPAPSDGMALFGHNNRVVGNTVKGYSNRGIFIQGDGNLIADNVVGDTVILGAGTGHGIWVYQGQRNLIQGNEIEGNAGCGIALDASSGENAYRKNLLRGNSGGAVCDSGTGNTDAGGNIP